MDNMTSTGIPASLPTTSSIREVIRRIRRLPPTFLIGSLVLIFFLILALTGRFWAPYSATKTGTGLPFSPISVKHWFGTDQLGRDIFSRIVLGTDDVLFLSLSGTLIAMILGVPLGLLSGLVRGWFDEVFMRILDVIISIPLLILALLVIAAAGPQLSGNSFLLIGVIAVVYAPRIARMARAVALNLVTSDFVTVARLRGESTLWIILHELAPNATGVILVEFGVRAGYAPILIGSLGFLGFGVRPPTPEWGVMISENRIGIVTSPVTVIAPALALAVLVIGLNLFTDGMARILGRSTNQNP
jgi:peptide/nickel transport system permease protein